MNTFFALAVATLAIVSSEETYSTGSCSPDETDNAFLKLAPLAGDNNLTACANKTDFDLIKSTTLPTDVQIKNMCDTPECKGLIHTIKTASPPNCVLTLPSTLKINILKMANDYEPQCTNLVPGVVHA